jgi:uncharacterized protein
MPKYGRGYTGGSRSIVGSSEKTKRKYIYSDFDFVFSPSPLFLERGLSGDIVRRFDAESIKQSVRNLIMTNKKERPWKPQLGANIRDILFENVGAWERWDVEENIRNTLERYEPRITLDAINFSENERTQDVGIEINYRINPINSETTTEQITVSIATQRIR